MPSLNTKLATAPNTSSNYVLKATTSTTIGNSLIQDSGTIGVNMTPDANVFSVTGIANNWATSTWASTTTGQSFGAIIRGGTNSSDVALRVNNAANSSTYFTVNGNGNIGIGTSSPSGLLQLNGSIASSGDAATFTIKQSSTTYTNGIYLERGGERNGYFMYIGGALDALTFRRNYFGTQSDVMSLTRDGNVGIGTSSPASLLSLVQSNSASSTTLDITNLSNASNTTKTAQLLFRIADTDTSPKPAASIVSYPDGVNVLSAGMYFSTRSGDGGPFERMRITGGGFTKISNNGSYFNVADTFHEMSNSATTSWTTIFRNTSADPYGIRILFSGASPNGGSNYFIYAQDNTTVRYTVSSNGSASSSDKRLKKNIETTRDGYLEDLCKLRVVKYNWFNQEDTDDKLLGVIAQEVEEVFPKLIKEEKSTDETTTYKMIKDSVLPYMLLKAIQELNTKLQDQQQTINSLINR